MVSSLEFRFDVKDANGRDKAREKFLRTFLGCCRRIRKTFTDQGTDDPFLELMLLQGGWQHFIRYERGYPRLDNDMKPNVVGPIAECLFAFDGIVKGNLLRDFEK